MTICSKHEVGKVQPKPVSDLFDAWVVEQPEQGNNAVKLLLQFVCYPSSYLNCQFSVLTCMPNIIMFVHILQLMSINTSITHRKTVNQLITASPYYNLS